MVEFRRHQAANMMLPLSSFTVILSFVFLATAHFSVTYPPWRGDSFAVGASQYLWPCANISQTDANRANHTLWPLTGGSINLHVGHPWAPTFVNLGFGNTVVNFNVSLVPMFNQTGNGTFCIREAGRQALAKSGVNVTEGLNATVQVIQIGEAGSALYNCADISFSSTAQLLANDQCTNSTGVGGVQFQNAATSTTASASASATRSAAAASSTGAAMSWRGNGLGALAGVMGVAAFAL